MSEPKTLNEMFAASRIPPGEPGSLWVEQKPCPRCKQVVWWAKDGHDLTLRSPQVHSCLAAKEAERLPTGDLSSVPQGGCAAIEEAERE